MPGFDNILLPITYSDFSDADSMYNNFNIFILSGFTDGFQRFDLLGKYNKLTNKFSFSDIAYNPEKHDGYLHIDPDDIPIKPLKRPERNSGLSRLGYHPKRGGGNIHENNTANRFEYSYIIIFK